MRPPHVAGPDLDRLEDESRLNLVEARNQLAEAYRLEAEALIALRRAATPHKAGQKTIKLSNDQQTILARSRKPGVWIAPKS
jgi:hypothetical protein